MNHWDKRFIEMATLVASWSKDPSTKVGCTIADKNRVVSVGFNGFPHSVDDSAEIYADRPRKLSRTIHAERNAIMFAKRDLSGCTMYVTHAPCSPCAAMIIQSGITRVVCPNPWLDEDYISRWKDDVLETEVMCCEAGVKLEYTQNGPEA